MGNFNDISNKTHFFPFEICFNELVEPHCSHYFSTNSSIITEQNPSPYKTHRRSMNRRFFVVVVIIHRGFCFVFYYQRMFGNVHIDNTIDGTFYYHWFECRGDNKRLCSEIWPKFSISCCIVRAAVCNNQPSNMTSSFKWTTGYENNRQYDKVQNQTNNMNISIRWTMKLMKFSNVLSGFNELKWTWSSFYCFRSNELTLWIYWVEYALLWDNRDIKKMIPSLVCLVFGAWCSDNGEIKTKTTKNVLTFIQFYWVTLNPMFMALNK